MQPLAPKQLNEFVSGAVLIATQAGDVLRQHWGKLKSVTQKEHTTDLVTDADRASEALIIHQLEHYFPGHSILSEEGGGHETHQEEFLWVVDPLDGTTNYTHQFPFIAVSIALLYQGKPVVGVVYNPILHEFFHAAKGLGAHLNGQAIAVSQTSNIETSLLASGFPYDRQENNDNNYAEFCRLTHISQGVRRAGAASIDIAYVASGRLDAYWEKGIKPWDIAAGIILVEEAGGTVTDYNNTPLDLFSGRILASNGFIHQAVSKELLQVRSSLV